MRFGRLFKRRRNIIATTLCLSLVAGFAVSQLTMVKSMAATTSSVTTVSILSQNLREPKSKDGAPNTLAKRAPRIQKLLAKYNADINCFQECSAGWKKKLDTNMPYTKYDCVFGYNNKGVCNPIYFKTSRYKRMAAGIFTITPDSTNTYNERRIATWVKLKDKKTNKYFLVVNAHTTTEKTRQIKGADVIMNMVAKLGYKNYIICGDFNMSKASNPTAYNKMLRNGTKDMAIVAKTEGTQGYTGGTFHNFGKTKSPQRIAYFFGSKTLRCNYYSILKDKYNGYYQ